MRQVIAVKYVFLLSFLVFSTSCTDQTRSASPTTDEDEYDFFIDFFEEINLNIGYLDICMEEIYESTEYPNKTTELARKDRLMFDSRDFNRVSKKINRSVFREDTVRVEYEEKDGSDYIFVEMLVSGRYRKIESLKINYTIPKIETLDSSEHIVRTVIFGDLPPIPKQNSLCIRYDFSGDEIAEKLKLYDFHYYKFRRYFDKTKEYPERESLELKTKNYDIRNDSRMFLKFY